MPLIFAVNTWPSISPESRPNSIKAFSKLASGIAVIEGQVPQTGLFSSVNDEFVLKSVGSELILETHQFDISWLKAVAKANIPSILVTLLTTQSPIGWLKDDAS